MALFPLSASRTETVTVIVDGHEISGWIDVEIRCAIDLMPWVGSLSVTTFQPVDGKDVYIQEGAPCQLKLGKDLLLTGYIVTVTETTTSSSHTLGIQLASKSMDLTECSAEVTNFQMNQAKVLTVCQKICEFAGIQVKSDTVLDDAVLSLFSIILTETPYEIIDRICRLSGIVFYDQPDGNVLLTSVGSKRMFGGLEYGYNIEQVTEQRSQAGRYSKITAVIQNTVMLFAQPGDKDYVSQMEAVTPAGCTAADPGIKRQRELLIPVDLGDANYTIAKRRVAWEVARRYGRSCPLHVTVDSWRDFSGQLWQVNALVIYMGREKNGKADLRELLITEVSFHQSLEGTRASLTLMPKEAFLPQPLLNPAQSSTFMQALENGGTTPKNTVPL